MLCSRFANRCALNVRFLSVCSRLNSTETAKPKIDFSAITDSQYFELPKEMNDRLFRLNGWREMHKEMFKLLGGVDIMVRQPFKELVNYLSRTEFSRPANHYILYGNFGNGKTFTINHFIYFCHLNDYIILHCPAPYEWIYYPQEIASSDWNNERIDTPVEATIALKAFKDQNSELLKNFDLRTTKKYTWSVQEATEEGEPLINVVDYGLNRLKKASDCFAVLLKELKLAANEGKIKLLVACDVVNILYYDHSHIKYPDGHIVSVDNVTIARAMKELMRKDWKNGLIVTAVDSTDSFRDKVNRLTGEKFGPDLPKHLLTTEGFHAFDPFIPIKVDGYSDKEIENCLDLYQRKKFITHPATKTEMGRNEIKFMSVYNPLEVYKFCWPL